MSEELKRCPFCDREAKIYSITEYYADGTFNEIPAVECQNCFANVYDDTYKGAKEL